MAIQYIQERPGFGSLLGAGVGQGIADTLDSMLQQRMKLLQSQQERQQQIGGIQKSLAPLMQNRYGMSPEEAERVAGDLGGFITGLPQEMRKNLSYNMGGVMDMFAGKSPIAQAAQAQAEGKVGMSSSDVDQVTDLFKSPEFKLREKEVALKERGLAEKKESRDIERAYKETEPFRKQMDELIVNLPEDERINAQMSALNEEELSSPAAETVYKVLGIDNIAALRNPESQQFQKLQQYYLRNLKNLFGGRLNEFEVREYMKGIPTLLNSKEGRRKILQDIKLSNQIRRIQTNEYKKLLKENDYVPTRDMLFRWSERVEPKAAKLMNKTEWMNQIKSRIPKKDINEAAEATRRGDEGFVEHDGFYFKVNKDGSLEFIPALTED